MQRVLGVFDFVVVNELYSCFDRLGLGGQRDIGDADDIFASKIADQVTGLL